LETMVAPKVELAKLGVESLDAMKSFAAFDMGEMKFPENKIGEIASGVSSAIATEVQPTENKSAAAGKPAPPPLPNPKMAIPPPLRPNFNPRRNWRK
jgi:hypothetical protein